MTEKASLFIKKAIPEHVIDSGSALVQFLQSYYEWSEQEGYVASDIAELLQNKNIDTARADYLEFFRREFLPSIPVDAKVDKALLLKYIVDFYQSRGTERSYRFLFAILFNEAVKLTYPRDTLFMTSAAKWVVERSVFVESDVSLSGYDFQDTYLINGLRKTIVFVTYAVQIRPGLYEVFFNTEKTLPSRIDYLRINGTDYSVVPTIATPKILEKGSGFAEGSIYTITRRIGTPIQFRVSKVTATGGVRSVTILRYGTDYAVPSFKVSVSPTEIDTREYMRQVSLGNFETSSHLTQIDEYGLVVNNDYAKSGFDANGVPDQTSSSLLLDFVNGNYQIGSSNPADDNSAYFLDNTYAGNLKAIFDEETGITDESSCVLFFEQAFFTSYIGYHTDIKGFTSDQSKIINSDDIQEYAYTIETNVDFARYATLVEKLLNPAGLKFSAEKGIEVTASLSLSLTNFLAILNIELFDTVTTSEGNMVFDFIKILVDVAVAQELVEKDFGKVLADTFTSSDAQAKDFFKVLTDASTTGDATIAKDFFKVLTDASTTSETQAKDFGKVLTDTFTSSETQIVVFGKVLTDASTTSETQAKDFGKVLADTSTTSETLVRDFGKSLSDASTTSETLVNAFGKTLADSTSTDTSSPTFVMSKSLSDSVTTSDSLQTAAAMDDQLADTAAVADLAALTFSTPRSDASTVSDTVTIQPQKAQTDLVTADDTGGLAADPIYVGDASDGNELQRRYWEYTYLQGEQVFT